MLGPIQWEAPHVILSFIISDANCAVCVTVGEKSFKQCVIPLATVFNDPMPPTRGNLSTDRKSITVSAGFSFLHAFDCEHFSVPSSINYFI